MRHFLHTWLRPSLLYALVALFVVWTMAPVVWIGTREGLLGGINAVIVGNYLTTLGRDPREDLALLDELEMPIKALNDTF